MKIAIIGDSITNGAGATNPRILADEINKHDPSLGVALHGVDGDVTTRALSRLDVVCAEQADWNLVFFGANDSAAYEVELTAEVFAANLTEIAQRLGLDRTILLTPPYHNDTFEPSVRENRFVEAFRAQTLAVAEKFNMPVIDVYIAMQTDNSLLQADGLHFSDKGYEFLGKLIVNELHKIA